MVDTYEVHDCGVRRSSYDGVRKSQRILQTTLEVHTLCQSLKSLLFQIGIEHTSSAFVRCTPGYGKADKMSQLYDVAKKARTYGRQDALKSSTERSETRQEPAHVKRHFEAPRLLSRGTLLDVARAHVMHEVTYS